MRIVKRSYDDAPGALERVLVMLNDRAERRLAEREAQTRALAPVYALIREIARRLEKEDAERQSAAQSVERDATRC